MTGIVEIDVHGKNVETAVKEIKKYLDNAGSGTYVSSMATMAARESGMA